MHISKYQAQQIAYTVKEKLKKKYRSKISSIAHSPGIVRKAEKLHSYVYERKRAEAIRDEMDTKFDKLYNKIYDLIGDGNYGDGKRVLTKTEMARDLVKAETSGQDVDKIIAIVVTKSVDAKSSDEIIALVMKELDA